MGMDILMVAEKPSIAGSIANALVGKNHSTRNGKTPIHEFQSVFRGNKAHFKVTSVTGHVYSCDFPKEYANWDAIDPKALFTAPVEKKAEHQGIIRHLQQEAKGIDYLILWLDCDREGENICFEVIDIVKSKMRNADDTHVLRAKFSAVTKMDIERAMNSLGLPNENESHAVDARQELDLKVGVAFSRFQTRYFQGKYGDLDSSLVSYGPCQTPTLGFCVDRHDEIQQFTPETFYCLDLQISKNGVNLTLDWERGRLFDQRILVAFSRLVEADKTVIVKGIKQSEGTKPRPIPLNTVKMLQAASKSLGMGPHTAMQMAERLYLQGYISYPRTESSSYPSSFDIGYALKQQAQNGTWGQYVQELLQQGYENPKKGLDAGDHPPITPVRAHQGELSGDMARLYDLITRHFIATVSADAKYLTTTVTFTCSEETFSVSGAQIKKAGFTAIVSSSSIAEQYLPSFQIGETFSATSLRMRTGQTSPPGYLTESELMGLMEKNGIGTDASISTHINNICERNYVQIGSGRTLIPTNLGIVLVHGYYKIDPELVLPKARASIEEQCTLIAKGVARKQDVVRHSIHIFEKKFEYFVRKIEAMDCLFEATFSPLTAVGKPLSKCGKCSRYMKYVPLKPQRLHCATCSETYNLPQNGTIKLYKELRCPLDKFELVLFSLGNSSKAPGKSYPLCPYCYNFPPFEGLERMGCDSCIHPTCKHSSTVNGIFDCPGHHEDQNCEGTIVLDVNSKPNWKMACNKCNLLIQIGGNVHQIQPTKETCPSCESTLLDVEFHKDKSPLKETTSLKGCILCNEILQSLTETKTGRFRHIKLSRGRRKGRGRGRYGKSRGRGKKGDPLMSFSDF